MRRRSPRTCPREPIQTSRMQFITRQEVERRYLLRAPYNSRGAWTVQASVQRANRGGSSSSSSTSCQAWVHRPLPRLPIWLCHDAVDQACSVSKARKARDVARTTVVRLSAACGQRRNPGSRADRRPGGSCINDRYRDGATAGYVVRLSASKLLYERPDRVA